MGRSEMAQRKGKVDSSERPAAPVQGATTTEGTDLAAALRDLHGLAAVEEPGVVESFVVGAFVGGFSDNTSLSAVGGQFAIGLVPIAGQIADFRDVAAAGKDLVDGKEGSGLGLGIAVVAVIPGLDFLKGARAERGLLREAAEETVEGAAKSGMKRVGKVLAKEALEKAGSDLKALAAGRVDVIARLEALQKSGGLSEGLQAALTKARNAAGDHLTASDLVGALRDELGVPVAKSGSGAIFQHGTEVADALRSLTSARDMLLRESATLPTDSAAFKSLRREADALSEMITRTRSFLATR